MGKVSGTSSGKGLENEGLGGSSGSGGPRTTRATKPAATPNNTSVILDCQKIFFMVGC